MKSETKKALWVWAVIAVFAAVVYLQSMSNKGVITDTCHGARTAASILAKDALYEEPGEVWIRDIGGWLSQDELEGLIKLDNYITANC